MSDTDHDHGSEDSCEELIDCILNCVQLFRREHAKRRRLRPRPHHPHAGPSSPGEPGASTPRPDDKRGRPLSSKDYPRATPLDERGRPVKPPTSSFCDWLLGKKPERPREGLPRREGRPEIPVEDQRLPLKPVKEEPRGRPIPEGLKPVKGEPGVYTTPSGRKVDSRGRPIPEGLKPVKGEPGVFKTPSGRKVDSRGRPIPEGLKPVRDEPGVFKTPSGRRVDGHGRPIPKDQLRGSPIDSEKPSDRPIPEKGRFCDWLLGRKPEK
ncbi:hypothetical protein M8J76_014889 [Diaphorina citri]|nr:hypothetical protein M8J76_014889 [Diaphorina citri]